ncbi:MAG: NUDIX domain-containing protein [Ornithinimicrobium sp.]
MPPAPGPAPDGRAPRRPAPDRLVVAAALVDDLNQPKLLLAARRSAPAALAGRWELPGGKVEPGELPEPALHRELAEELGITVALGAEAPGPREGMWPLRHGYLMRWWWATITDGVPQPLQDHDELRWVTRKSAQTLAWLDSNRAITAYLVPRMRTPD